MSQERLTVTCPFDLETIFTVSVDHSNLKGVLEWIIERLGTMGSDLNGMNKLLKEKVGAIDK